MPSEILHPDSALLQSFVDIFDYENLTTSVFSMGIHGMLACVALTCGIYFCRRLLISLCYSAQRNVCRIEYILQTAVIRIKRTKVSRLSHWLLLLIYGLCRIVFFSACVSFLVLSVYFSTYDDAKASILSFLGVALTVWLSKRIFSEIKSLNHPFLWIMEVTTYFLVVSGLSCLLCKFWTTGCYLACLGKIIEKSLNEARHSTMISRAHIHMDGKSSKVADSEMLEHPEITSVPESETGQHVSVDPLEEINQLELHGFLKLEDCNQVNAVINQFFEVLSKTQERFREIERPFQMYTDMMDGSVLKEIINEFAQSLEAIADRENDGELVHSEVKLEECDEVNLLVGQFIRHILLIHRREKRHWFGDQVDMRNGHKTNLLTSNYVQLINRFVRKLELIRGLKNTNLVDNPVRNVMNEPVSEDFQTHGVVSVQPAKDDSQLTMTDSEVFEEHVESIKNRRCSKVHDVETLDDNGKNESVEDIRDVNVSVVENGYSSVKKDILDDCAIITLNNFVGDNSVSNELNYKLKNIEVMGNEEVNRAGDKPTVESSTYTHGISWNEQCSSEMCNEDPCDDDLIKKCRQQSSLLPIIISSEEMTGTEVPDHDETKLANVESVKQNKSVPSGEDPNSLEIQNIGRDGGKFQVVETLIETEQIPTSIHSPEDVASLTDVGNSNKNQTEILIGEPVQKNATFETPVDNEKMDDRKNMAGSQVSAINPNENLHQCNPCVRDVTQKLDENTCKTDQADKFKENVIVEDLRASKERENQNYEATPRDRNLKVRELIALLESQNTKCVENAAVKPRSMDSLQARNGSKSQNNTKCKSIVSFVKTQLSCSDSSKISQVSSSSKNKDQLGTTGEVDAKKSDESEIVRKQTHDIIKIQENKGKKDAFNNLIQSNEYVVTNKQNTSVESELPDNLCIHPGELKQSVRLLELREVSQKNIFMKQNSVEESLTTPKCDFTEEINCEEISGIKSFAPIISRKALKIVERHSSNTYSVKDLSTNKCETTKRKAKATEGDVGNKDLPSRDLSCVDDVVNKIDVRFIYGLSENF